MRRGQRRARTALALLGIGTTLGALLAAGCSSTSNTNDTARIRAVNVATNAGTADVLVNGGAAGGDLTFQKTTAYNYIGQGASTFSFTTNATLQSSITLPLTPTLTLNNGSFYTAYLIGRSDLAGAADPRFLQTVITGDRGAAANYTAGTVYADPPSGQANVRILNAAPDAGAVDVRINGAVAFANVTYPAFPTQPAGASVATALPPATIYKAFSGGTISVQVNAAGSGTVLVPAANIGVTSGQVYTIMVTEPTVAPTYGLYTLTDQP